MNKYLSLLFACCLLTTQAMSQSTALRVYEILQDKCVSCHGGTSPSANLSLDGTPVDVYNRIVTNGQVANAHAQSQGYKQIYPGRADKSFLFRKINADLEATIVLDPSEHDGNPHGDKGLTDVEKELIRQFALYGAPSSGTVVDESLLVKYYSGQGTPSFPAGPPAAPDPSEGFQIKMGPFFLKDEVGFNEELFTKFELDLGNDREIVRIQTIMSPASHHFIVYSYNNKNAADNMAPGFRPYANHSQTNLVSAVQEPTDLRLPQGSAFKWDTDQVLDLNSHYINYNGQPYAAEAYLNVYTQPSGVAAQEMNAILIPNTNICIPNDEQTHTSTRDISYPLGDIYMWGIMGHTHQYGTGYKVWTRINGQKGDLIYDGACPNGQPGCPAPNFDYQHIPLRYVDPFLPLDMGEGLVHEASWMNDGPNTVCWGDNSDDEMMVLIGFYLTDTTGVTQNETPTAIKDFDNPLDGLIAFPNPMQTSVNLSWPTGLGLMDVSIFDLMGRKIEGFEGVQDNQLSIKRKDLTAGIYVYRVTDKNGNQKSGKLVVSD